VKLGGVVVSPSGKLASQGVKHVFHAATIPSGTNRIVDDPIAVVTEATRQAVDLVQAMHLESVALPALGTGHAKFKPADVAIAMSREIRAKLAASSRPLLVEIWLLFGNQRDAEAVAFFAEFTKHAQLETNAVCSHAVVLIHGIRTAAGWRERIGNELEAANAGLTPIPIGYEFFDVVRFLAPIGSSRRDAAETVWNKMKTIYDNPNIEHVSVIAHSFGTWIVGHILKNHTVKFHRVILCGSVLSTTYDWDGVQDKIAAPPFKNAPTVKIVNDCGTKDIWPIMAKFMTWGYGVAGRWGFQHALVKDRFHQPLTHSDFFKHGFATNNWVPVLNGTLTKGADKGIDPPGWMNLLTILKLPYLLLAAIALWFVLRLK
jgi:pimeloyl-ACP methyl ester carboxylesterase